MGVVPRHTIGYICIATLIVLPNWTSAAETAAEYPVQPVPFTQVHFDDAFWAPRLTTSSKVTLPACFKRCEQTGRIDNFAVAGGLMEGFYRGARYNDSDVYQVIEGAAYQLSVTPLAIGAGLRFGVQLSTCVFRNKMEMGPAQTIQRNAS